MNDELTNCPRCNALHTFKPKKEDTEHAWQVVVLKCPTCRWRKVLDYTSPIVEAAHKRYLKWVERVNFEADRHGTATSSAMTKMNKCWHHWQDLRDKLMEEVRNAEADADPARNDRARSQRLQA